MSDSLSNYSKSINFASSIEYSENAVVSKKIVANNGGNISLFAFDKDQALSEHTAPFDALLQVLEGNVEITLNKEVHQLTMGESIVMPANIPHALKAIRQFKMLLTMIKD